MGRSGRALPDGHLSDDETVAKMGHPILWRSGRKADLSIPLRSSRDGKGGSAGEMQRGLRGTLTSDEDARMAVVYSGFGAS